MLLENYIMVALSMGFGDIKHVDEVCCQPAGTIQVFFFLRLKLLVTLVVNLSHTLG
ncbi:hypothetical protein MTR67_040630 [Solanum verrucosum]|uniref:Uncharacterized protein n=1 Tax=Solanum verrucosum TaxID=315347 RepID=A0AAF0UIW2_SOLVR|nr:hypothetical protein MTR67_040630 [Solanum verrucosum]